MNKVIQHEKLIFSEVEEMFVDLMDSLKKVKGKKNKDNLASRLIDVNEDMEKLKTRMDNLLIEINTCYAIEVSEKEQERKNIKINRFLYTYINNKYKSK